MLLLELQLTRVPSGAVVADSVSLLPVVRDREVLFRERVGGAEGNCTRTVQ